MPACDNADRFRAGIQGGRQQVHDLQRDALVAAGVDPDYIYEDAASGWLDKRPELDAYLKALRRTDTLVTWKLDRLGRGHKVMLADLERTGEDQISLTDPDSRAMAI